MEVSTPLPTISSNKVLSLLAQLSHLSPATIRGIPFLGPLDSHSPECSAFESCARHKVEWPCLLSLRGVCPLSLVLWDMEHDLFPTQEQVT